jgi:hypothetical protein
MLLLAALLAVGLSSPWWAGKQDHLWHILTSHLDSSQVRPRGNPAFLAGLWFYSRAMGQIAGWPVLLAVLGLTPVLLLRRVRGPRLLQRQLMVLCLMTSVLGGVVGLCVGVHRESRYLLPALPLMALLSVLGLMHLRRRPRELLGAALLATVVAPTLWLAANPLPVWHWAAQRGIVDWATVRVPHRQIKMDLADQLTDVLRSSTPRDRRGERIYLLLVNAADANYLPRLGSFMIPRFPELMFSFSNNLAFTNSRWHLLERHRRQMFLLTETTKTFNLPLLWSVQANWFNNPTPLRLYLVPAGHVLRGPIDRYALYRVRDARGNATLREGTLGGAPGKSLPRRNNKARNQRRRGSRPRSRGHKPWRPARTNR